MNNMPLSVVDGKARIQKKVKFTELHTTRRINTGLTNIMYVVQASKINYIINIVIVLVINIIETTSYKHK
jgi:hypothetical protein